MKHLIFLLAFLSSSAFAGERVIINPDSNGDLKIKANVGGTVKDALVVTGSTGALTLGPSTGATGTVTHTVQNGTTGNAELSVKTGNNASGYSILSFTDGTYTSQIRKAPAANGMEFFFDAVNTGSITPAGSWTLGPAGFTGNHTVNGKIVGTSGTSPVRFPMGVRGDTRYSASISGSGTHTSTLLLGARSSYVVTCGLPTGGGNDAQSTATCIYGGGSGTCGTTVSHNEGSCSLGTIDLVDATGAVTVVFNAGGSTCPNLRCEALRVGAPNAAD